MSKILLAENIADPDTPSAGKVVVFFRSDGFAYSKNDAGVVTKLTNEAAVDAWRSPVLVHDISLYSNIPAVEAAANVADTLDGVTIAADDRVLISNVTSGNENVYIVSGSSGNWTLTEDSISATDGDILTVNDGTFSGTFFYFDGSSWHQGAPAAGSSWREPALVHDSELYADIAAVVTAANVADTINGVTIAVGNRVLISNLTSGNENVYLVGGSSGNWTLTEDSNLAMDGDAILINEGTSPDSMYIFDGTSWVERGGDVEGNPSEGNEINLGEGGKYTAGMLVYTYNGTGTYVDETVAATVIDDVRVTFPGTGVNNAIYIATTVLNSAPSEVEFYGVYLDIDTARVDGAVVWEYYNGSAWTTLGIMNVSDSGFFPTATDTLDVVGQFNIRFDDRWRALSVTTDLMSLGTTHHWVRIRITSTLTTLPQIDQIQIHPNYQYINSQGFTEYYGVARSMGWWPMVFTHSINVGVAVPSDQNLFLSDTLARGLSINSFSKGGTNRITIGFLSLFDMDTSCPLRFRVLFQSPVAGDAVINVYWAFSQDGSGIFINSSSTSLNLDMNL